jgi:nucleoside-diphosphate-sugar epimerase
MTRQRILVTGATSPLGQAVGRQLKAAGHIGIGTTRVPIARDHLPMYDHLVQLDLENLRTLDDLEAGFDSIIHVAASSVGTAAHLMNVTGIATTRLADWALKQGVQNFIHVSSMSVYGRVDVPEVSACTEIHHSSPYGAAKWASECYLNSLSSQLPAVSIRSCAIVGRRSHRNFLAEVFCSMANQETRIFASNPEFLFNNVIHEETLAELLVHLTSTHKSGFKAVPVGSTHPISLSKVLEMIAERTRFRGVVEWVPPRSSPFCIDVSDAVGIGLRPLSTVDTVDRWLSVAIASRHGSPAV